MQQKKQTRIIALVRFIDFQKPINRILVQGALLLTGLWFFTYYFGNIASYLIISLILSAILGPIVNFLHDLQFFGIRMPRVLAVMLSFLIFFGFLITFLVLFAPLVYDQIQLIKSIQFDELLKRGQIPLLRIERFLNDSFDMQIAEGQLLQEIQRSLLRLLDSVRFGDLFNTLLSFAGQFFIGTLAVFFITFFFLYEKNFIHNLLTGMIPNRYFEVGISTIDKIERLLSNYLLGILLQMVAIFTIVSTGLSLLNIPYAITIGVFAAVANLIPYLGPVLGGSFGLIVGISSIALHAELSTQAVSFLALKILIVFAITQLTDNVVLQPVIFSRSVKAHPLAIFIAIFFGANIAGGIGMIFAIPVYTIFKVIISELQRGIKEYQVFKKEREVILKDNRDLLQRLP
ncbi:MAG: AI-2E family transporter [Thermonema sp.]|uniref:AI-2E family transporter n=1 Tax=Thermonema sp. TaxID=2231181 RepID=UPI0021DC6EE5|nr:AI-2E family transporter [Thermonema sp.]GIV40637.1 MAG: AI-2E family transporter [Thermonema sp.]